MRRPSQTNSSTPRKIPGRTKNIRTLSLMRNASWSLVLLRLRPLLLLPPAAAERLEQRGGIGVAVGDRLRLVEPRAAELALRVEKREEAHPARGVAGGYDVVVAARLNGRVGAFLQLHRVGL